MLQVEVISNYTIGNDHGRTVPSSSKAQRAFGLDHLRPATWGAAVRADCTTDSDTLVTALIKV